METRESSLSRLKIILDQLGPGAWLHLDDRWMMRLFGFVDVGPEKNAGIDAATDFARRNGCAFRYEEDTQMGVFRRALFKRDDDA
jgi:hypothetical protein